MYNLATIMQGCTTYIQPSQGCVHLAKDDHKVVCTLQMLMQGCHKLAATLQGCNKLAARLPQPRNFHMGYSNYFSCSSCLISTNSTVFIT